ncbi:MAG TPA: hypothetical protein VMA55_14245 [Acidovorax sp.]|jgi:hypothetical protein|nr:hypothetical protein [Acidovorax sp.]
MTPFRWIAIFCVIAAVALAVAGLGGAAGLILLLGTAIEIVGAMFTGKRGNDTER